MAPNPPQSGPRGTTWLCEGSVQFSKELGAAWAPSSEGAGMCVGAWCWQQGLCAPGHLGFCKSACDYTQGFVPVWL